MSSWWFLFKFSWLEW